MSLFDLILLWQVALKVAIDGAIWGFAGNWLLVGLRGMLEVVLINNGDHCLRVIN